MSAAGGDGPGPFTAADLALLGALARHNELLRALLCTLARRGKALRRDEPARARAWLDALAVHPYYKGGQFLFDLLEWEDFMLDGDAPPLLDDAALAAALGRVAQVLDALRAVLDGVPVVPAPAQPIGVAADLPPLAGNAYLYPDVVLGTIAAITSPPR